jgi:hypothetical protein
MQGTSCTFLRYRSHNHGLATSVKGLWLLSSNQVDEVVDRRPRFSTMLTTITRIMIRQTGHGRIPGVIRVTISLCIKEYAETVKSKRMTIIR